MNEFVILESLSLRQSLCTDENVAILEKVGQLVLLPNTEFATIENLAKFYEVPVETIRTIVHRHGEELQQDGYKTLNRKDFREFHNETLKSKSRSIAIFPRRAILRIGMLLRDSEVAKKVRSYLLNVEQAVSSVASGTIEEMLDQLTRQAVQLQKNADQLVSQSMMIAAIFNKVGENQQKIEQVENKVESHERRIDVLEELACKVEIQKESEYISEEQAMILRKRVKAKGNPDRVWARFRLHFEITRYKFLPRSRFREALDWLESYEEGGNTR